MSCSRATFAVGQEKVGVVNEELIRALGAFGGGIAASCQDGLAQRVDGQGLLQ